MSNTVRVLHYLNQFFGGLGGEEEANRSIEAREGPVGPGNALQNVLGSEATVVATLIGGDNYTAEYQDETAKAVQDGIARFRPDVVIAGPAFDAGRYGLACAIICLASQKSNVPAITAMHPDSPGVITHGRDLIVVPTGTEVSEMQAILQKVSRLALKMARREELGPALEEGYLPRGIRRPILRPKTGAERAVDILEARMTGQPFASEAARRDFDLVSPPPSIPDLGQATVAMVSTGGLVPKGNPDRLESGRTTERAHKYSVEGLPEFTIEGWEVIHTGYRSHIVNSRDTNYQLPLRSLRALEGQGKIGKLHPYFYSTAGNGMSVKAATRVGQQIAGDFKEAGVNAVVLVAT